MQKQKLEQWNIGIENFKEITKEPVTVLRPDIVKC